MLLGPLCTLARKVDPELGGFRDQYQVRTRDNPLVNERWDILVDKHLFNGHSTSFSRQLSAITVWVVGDIIRLRWIYSQKPKPLFNSTCVGTINHE